MTRRTAVPLTLLALAGPALVAPPAIAAPSAPRTVVALGHPLPLGPAGLAETRTTRTLQPGVTLTRIVRGHTDPSAVWTVEVAVPSGVRSGRCRSAPGSGSRSAGGEGQYAAARGLLR
jgi:hypothetical protein